MQISLKKAIAAALLSVAPVFAFADSITPPASGPAPGTGAAGGSGLIVYAWDQTLGKGLVEWLGPTQASFAPGGALDPTNPNGVTYDFGVLGGTTSWNSLFSGDTNPITFAVFAADSEVANQFSLETTGPITGLGTVRNSTVGTAVNGLLTQIGNLSGLSSNPITFTTASDAGSLFVNAVGTKINGAIGTGVTGTAGGAALDFYRYTQSSSTNTASASGGKYQNATAAGTFTLSASGDLVYSLAGPVSSVPLPAAVWLFGSGVLGLAGISRRRRVTA